MKHYEFVIKIAEILICVCVTVWLLVEPLRESADLVLDASWMVLAIAYRKKADLLKKYIDESIRRNGK